MKKNRFALFLALFLSPIFFLTFSCSSKKEEPKTAADSVKITSLESDKIVGLARIEPAGKIVQLFSEVNGIVSKILVKPGQEVKEGEMLLLLSSDVERSQLSQAQAKIGTQLAAVEVQKSTLKSQEVKLANARLILQRTIKMVEKGAQTQQVLDDVRTTAESLQAEMQITKAAIRQSEDRLKELQADIRYNQSLVARRTVKAPAAGKILSIDVLAGNLLTNNTVIGDFAANGNRMAVVEVDEMFAEKVVLGQPANIRRQGETETISKGKVVFVAPYLKKKSLFSDQVGSQEDRRIREVRIELEAADELLIGSRVEAVISTKP